jgi:L-lactate utilization protein LutB
MCTATLGATPVYRCTCAASSIFSVTVRGTPGWANTLNRVPVFPNAHDGTSIRCARSAVFTAVRSGITTHLQATDGVITTAALAIAETGTIVLDGGPGQGRRALSLVPDYHLCTLHASQIVGIVPQALERLEPGRPCTWISGPSATSDIELDRVQGVHGPRTLEVILAGPDRTCRAGNPAPACTRVWKAI